MLDVTSDTSAVPDRSAIAYLHAQLQRWVRATPILEKTDFEPVAVGHRRSLQVSAMLSGVST
ncbi:hypothetical protein L535_1352, partial [Bordetella bronchiseptica SBL-F6116]